MGTSGSVPSPASGHVWRPCWLPGPASSAGTSGRPLCPGSVPKIPYPSVHVGNSLIKTKRGWETMTQEKANSALVLELPLLLKPELHLSPRPEIPLSRAPGRERRNREFHQLPNTLFQPKGVFQSSGKSGDL
jgi:hypothetical protein